MDTRRPSTVQVIGMTESGKNEPSLLTTPSSSNGRMFATVLPVFASARVPLKTDCQRLVPGGMCSTHPLMAKCTRVPNGPVVLRLELIVNCPAKSASNLGVGRGLCANTAAVDAARMAVSDEKNEEQRILEILKLVSVHYVLVEVGVQPVPGTHSLTGFIHTRPPSAEALVGALPSAPYDSL